MTQFVFDASGHLLEEADAAGAVSCGDIWLDDMPVAVVDQTGTSPTVFYTHTDHLNRPQKMTGGA